MITQESIEAALDTGLVKWASAGNPWVVRRNGKTKMWKTRPGEFKIPVKVGFRSHAYITQDTKWLAFDADKGRIVHQF